MASLLALPLEQVTLRDLAGYVETCIAAGVPLNEPVNRRSLGGGDAPTLCVSVANGGRIDLPAAAPKQGRGGVAGSARRRRRSRD